MIPTEKRFFDMLMAQSAKTLEGVEALNEMVNKFENVEEKAKKIKRIEEEGDQLRHNITDELNKTFITPIDREDINALSSSLDNVLDLADGTSTRLVLFEIKKVPQSLINLADILTRATTEVNWAVECLAKAQSHKDFPRCHINIHKLENEGDGVQKNAIANLFKTEDVVNILKLKELIERVEDAIDRCEDVSDVIDDILMKSK
jgi:hypothetical protein